MEKSKISSFLQKMKQDSEVWLKQQLGIVLPDAPATTSNSQEQAVGK